MICVLFVCLGNICRSPMAEAVFMHKVKAAGLEAEIEADLAGTGGWHQGGRPIPEHDILSAKNIVYDHRARRLAHSDYPCVRLYPYNGRAEF